MRAVGVLFGVVFGLPYLVVAEVIRCGDLWLSGNLRDVVAVPCDIPTSHRT